MRWLVALCLAAPVALCPIAVLAQTPDLDFLEGRWIIQDASGDRLGVSDIEVQAPDAMLMERRQIDGRPPQLLWFENSERYNGWTQLFIGPLGSIREFAPLASAADWPFVLGGDVTLQDGSHAKFRMTLSRQSDDRTRRRLELSRDHGASWTEVFDYYYVRDTQVSQ